MSVSSFFRKIKICKEILDLFLCRKKKYRFVKKNQICFYVDKKKKKRFVKKNQICFCVIKKKQICKEKLDLFLNS